MKKTGKGYTEKHAKAAGKTPSIETWPNQYPGRNYTITINIPEFTSICPKTGLPDFGTITVEYVPDKLCIELKSLKYYILAYRSMGIFYENAVNKILEDIVKACSPEKLEVKGEFSVRGGMSTSVRSVYIKKK